MKCGYCTHPLTEILDMGSHALAGAFLKPADFAAEQRYPLRFGVCEACGGAQVMDKVEARLLFGNYFYRSSQIDAVRRHADAYARDLVQRFEPQSVLEIGCNDGVMLRTFERLVPRAVGIDPTDAAPHGLTVWRDFFRSEIAPDLGTYDLVVANHVFAHVPDINDLTEAVQTVLAPGGVFVMEAHYLGALIAQTQYDAIYHEHAYYHCLTTLERHFARFGLNVFHVEPVGQHGGSLRYFVDRCERTERASVHAVREAERDQGLDRIETYALFALRAQAHRQEIARLVASLRSVSGYGASGRANTLIQWAGLELAYIVDDSPVRQGMYTPGSHIPICARDMLDRAPTDYVLALAWTYLDDLKAKCPRPLVVPFPKPAVLERAPA